MRSPGSSASVEGLRPRVSVAKASAALTWSLEGVSWSAFR